MRSARVARGRRARAPRRPHSLIPWALALALLLPTGASAAPGADVLDFAPEETLAMVAFRGADALAQVTDLVDGRFGDVPLVARAIKRIRALEIAPGVKPAARAWGPGLELGRGLAAFITGPKKVRLVVGVSDAGLARRTLTSHFRALGARAEISPDGLIIEGQPMGCADAQGYLICEVGEAVPAVKAARPRWLAEPPVAADGDLLIFARGATLNQMSGAPAFFDEAWVGLTHSAGELEMRISMVPAVGFRGPLGLLVAEGPASGLPALVDRTTPFVFKLSLDAGKLMEHLERRVGRRPDAPFDALWDAARAHITGEVILAADAGMTHPVALIGIKSRAGGQALIKALLSLGAAMDPGIQLSGGPHPTRGAPLQALTLRFLDEDAPVTVHLSYGITDEALVVALSPADVTRRLEGRVQPLEMSEAFARRGIHGWRIVGAPGLFTGAWMSELFEVEGAGAVVRDFITLASVLGELVDEAGMTLTPGTERVEARMWWRFL